METIINRLYEQQPLTQEESQQLFDIIIRGCLLYTSDAADE